MHSNPQRANALEPARKVSQPRETGLVRAFLLLTGIGLAATIPSGVLQAEGPRPVIRLEPGETTEQLMLLGAGPGTHFAAEGVVAYGGISGHFIVPPRFRLFSDPKRDPAKRLGYASMAELERKELSNAECYPVQLRDMESPSLSGVTVIGMQARELPWRVMKAMWDGDALVVRGCRGDVTVSDVWFENVEDGFGPQPDLRSWTLENAYMRYIRDDAIENDDLIPGTIRNCLIDGCFVFLSQRPDEEQTTEAVTVVEDCVVHVEAQPHDGFENREWRDQYIEFGTDGIGRSPGMAFKWSEGCGTVRVSDTVIRIDAMSASGPKDMIFPPGTYENVVLVWTGPGDYPAPLPPGVRLTRDLTAWRHARQQWIDRLPALHPATARLKAALSLNP